MDNLKDFMKNFIALTLALFFFGIVKSVEAQGLPSCIDCDTLRRKAGAPSKRMTECTSNGYYLYGTVSRMTSTAIPCNAPPQYGNCTETLTWRQQSCHCPTPAPNGHNVEARDKIVVTEACTSAPTTIPLNPGCN